MMMVFSDGSSVSFEQGDVLVEKTKDGLTERSMNSIFKHMGLVVDKDCVDIVFDMVEYMKMKTIVIEMKDDGSLETHETPYKASDAFLDKERYSGTAIYKSVVFSKRLSLSEWVKKRVPGSNIIVSGNSIVFMHEKTCFTCVDENQLRNFIERMY